MRTGGPVGGVVVVVVVVDKPVWPKGLVVVVFEGFDLFERVRGVEDSAGGVKRVRCEFERYRQGSKRG